MPDQLNTDTDSLKSQTARATAPSPALPPPPKAGAPRLATVKPGMTGAL
jgi:hypothetical protein